MISSVKKSDFPDLPFSHIHRSFSPLPWKTVDRENTIWNLAFHASHPSILKSEGSCKCVVLPTIYIWHYKIIWDKYLQVWHHNNLLSTTVACKTKICQQACLWIRCTIAKFNTGCWIFLYPSFAVYWIFVCIIHALQTNHIRVLRLSIYVTIRHIFRI
jgi:hypothetical protein